MRKDIDDQKIQLNGLKALGGGTDFLKNHIANILMWVLLANFIAVWNAEAKETGDSCNDQVPKEYFVEKTGKDLGALHNQVYKALIADMERIVSSSSVRICGIHSGTRKNTKTGKYRLSYSIVYGDTKGRLPHKHIELKSHVWHEKKHARAWVEKRNMEEQPGFQKKWEKEFDGVQYFSFGGGDKDLYQAGVLAVAEGKKSGK